MEGYLVARVLAEGLRRAVTTGGRLTRDAIASALDGLSGQQVSGFPVAFQSQSTKGRFVELSMLTGDGRVKV